MSVVLITTPSAILLNADDPIERMLLLLGFLLMADEPDNLLFVLAGEVTLQGYVDAAAGRAQRLEGAFGPRHPSPSAPRDRGRRTPGRPSGHAAFVEFG